MKKISENASAKKLLDQLQCIETIGDIFGSGTHVDEFNEIKKQSAVLLVPDQFNEMFAQQGWIAYESMSVAAMLKAIEIEKKEGFATAEEFLASEYGEGTLKFGIQRCSGHAEFRKRHRLIELAKEDYLAARYHACIPLLLALVDGLVNDISKCVGFFAVEVDLVLQKEQATETVRTSVQVIFSDSANDAVRWGHSSGAWKIFQNGFTNVIYQQ